jgi:hypothetical protein
LESAWEAKHGQDVSTIGRVRGPRRGDRDRACRIGRVQRRARRQLAEEPRRRELRGQSRRREFGDDAAQGQRDAAGGGWAACERRHGDANQADPTIDAHGVINVNIPMLSPGGPGTAGSPQNVVIAGDPHDVTGTCSDYLAAAQRALSHGQPIGWAGGRDQATMVKYVECMRANGVPNYPYPSGQNEGDGNPTTNFNGTGVDPNGPFVVKISIECGGKLGAPLWWSAGWGPPGDVAVQTTPPKGAPPLRALVRCADDGGSRRGWLGSRLAARWPSPPSPPSPARWRSAPSLARTP